MWSYVRSKAHPRWLWHAIDHHTGTVLAYVLGRRQDTVFLELKALLEPFGITRYFTDGWGAYERHVETEQHTVGKAHTQKIESKHIIYAGISGWYVEMVFKRKYEIGDGLFIIGMNLGCQSDMQSTHLKHLRLPLGTPPHRQG